MLMIMIQKSRNLVFAAVLSIILLNSSFAGEKTALERKTLAPKTLRSMARVYMAYGDYAKAQPLAEQALASAKTKATPDSELCLCMIDLAYLYFNQNRLDEAEQLCITGLNLQEKIYTKDHPYVAYTLRTLGAIYRDQGKFAQARATINKAITIMLACHPADEPVMAPFKIDMAELAVAEGDFEKAENYYLQALDLIGSSYGKDHLYTANVLGGLAELYTTQGRFTEAEPLINHARAVQEIVYGSEHYLVAPAWLTTAKICQAKGDYLEAERLLHRAAAAVEKTGDMTASAKLQQRIGQIRGQKQIAYKQS